MDEKIERDVAERVVENARDAVCKRAYEAAETLRRAADEVERLAKRGAYHRIAHEIAWAFAHAGIDRVAYEAAELRYYEGLLDAERRLAEPEPTGTLFRISGTSKVWIDPAETLLRLVEDVRGYANVVDAAVTEDEIVVVFDVGFGTERTAAEYLAEVVEVAKNYHAGLEIVPVEGARAGL